MMSEIDKIINQSSRQELIEFLGDTSFDLDSALLLYCKQNGEYGFRKLDTSSNIFLIGMLKVICNLFERVKTDAIEEDTEEKEED